MSRLRFSFLFFAAVFCPTFSTPAPAADSLYHFNFQSVYYGPHALNIHLFMPWLEEVRERSGGRLNIDFHVDGELFRLEEVPFRIMSGDLDMGGVTPQYADRDFPYTLSLTIPHIAKDSRHATRMYWEAYKTRPEIRDEWAKIGKLLTLWGTDRAGFFSTKGPILSPLDIRNKRVLHWTPSQSEQVRAWGGIPVQVAPADTFFALQGGMGDIFFGPLPVGVAYDLMAVSSDITVIPAYTTLVANVMNWEAWNALPPDLQELVTLSTGPEAGQLTAQVLYEQTNKDLGIMKAAGCVIHELTADQYQVFRDADREATLIYWRKRLKRVGIENPDGLLDQALALSASTAD